MENLSTEEQEKLGEMEARQSGQKENCSTRGTPSAFRFTWVRVCRGLLRDWPSSGSGRRTSGAQTHPPFLTPQLLRKAPAGSAPLTKRDWPG